MRAINHSLSGAVIGLSIANPVVAIPMAFVSHFVLDSLPHFGVNGMKYNDSRFKAMLAADALLSMLLVGWLYMSGAQYWLLASFCAFAAASPDFMWAPGFFSVLRGGSEDKENNAFKRFHARVQWFERPSGVWVELAFASALAATLAKLVNI